MGKNQNEFDKDRAEKFAGEIIETLNKGSLALMISIGHRTGLFDIMSEMDSAAVNEISSKANLNERYVREWLGSMVTSRVISYDPDNETFSLPTEHASFLTRKAGADNLAVFAQYISVMGEVENEIVECFSKGGGVPYPKYSRFHEVMAEDSGQSVLLSLESHIIPLIPGLEDKLKKGIKVLDAGCGSGLILLKLAELFPNSKFTGMDLSQETTAKASKAAAEKDLKNLKFVQKDLTDFDTSAPEKEFDFITTFDAIHDQAKPLNVLKGIYRALRDDGVYLMQEISGTGHLEKDIEHPIGTFLYTISCMHCMTVSLAENGEGLGAMWGEVKTREYLSKAGFRSIETNKLAHDIQNNWYVVRK
jgi:ubiquinone/menaquinone biosynthesis C-methylase UbiE